MGQKLPDSECPLKSIKQIKCENIENGLGYISCSVFCHVILKGSGKQEKMYSVSAGQVFSFQPHKIFLQPMYRYYHNLFTCLYEDTEIHKTSSSCLEITLNREMCICYLAIKPCKAFTFLGTRECHVVCCIGGLQQECN